MLSRRELLESSAVAGAGLCSPDRKTLFANIQDEGYVLATTGPFARLRRM